MYISCFSQVDHKELSSHEIGKDNSDFQTEIYKINIRLYLCAYKGLSIIQSIKQCSPQRCYDLDVLRRDAPQLLLEPCRVVDRIVHSVQVVQTLL